MAKKKEKKGFTPELYELFDTLYAKLREYGQCCAFIAICDNKRDQMEAYANTMCPASQTFEAETKEEFDAKVAEFKKNFEDEAWLAENIDLYL